MSGLLIPAETTRPPAKTKVKTLKEVQPVREKKFANISTQTQETEWSESHYYYDGHLFVVPPPPIHNSGLAYYNTSYSGDSHLYSTLV